MNYTAEFAEPGTYDVRFTLATPGDTAPDNDTLERVVLVRPYNDIGVAGSVDLPEFVVGQTREKTFTLTVDRRDLASARFTAPHYLPGLRVDAIRASAGECRVDDIAGGICEFTDLPAFAQRDGDRHVPRARGRPDDWHRRERVDGRATWSRPTTSCAAARRCTA